MGGTNGRSIFKSASRIIYTLANDLRCIFSYIVIEVEEKNMQSVNTNQNQANTNPKR